MISAKYPVTLKQPGWPLSVAVLVVLAILGLWVFRPTVFLVVGMLLIGTYGLGVFLRFLFLAKRELKIQDDSLVLFDSKDREIGRLDLNTPFEVEYLFKGNDNALYQLTQGKKRFQFSAETQGAEQVVRDVLQLKWPPPTRFWWPLS